MTGVLYGLGGALAGLTVGCSIAYYTNRALTARNLHLLTARQDDDAARARRAVLLARTSPRKAPA